MYAWPLGSGRRPIVDVRWRVSRMWMSLPYQFIDLELQFSPRTRTLCQQHKYYSLEEVTLSMATHFSFLLLSTSPPPCNQHLPSPDDLLLIREEAARPLPCHKCHPFHAAHANCNRNCSGCKWSERQQLHAPKKLFQGYLRIASDRNLLTFCFYKWKTGHNFAHIYV